MRQVDAGLEEVSFGEGCLDAVKGSNALPVKSLCSNEPDVLIARSDQGCTSVDPPADGAQEATAHG